MVDLPDSHEIGLGCSGLGNEFGSVSEADAIRIVHGALDLGITYFDTSPYYGRTLSEERLGKALGRRRDRVFLATKAGRHGEDAATGFDFSYRGILDSCDASLQRLRTDHIDLLQLHDVEFGLPSQIIDEAIPALAKALESGKARFAGVTGYPLPVLADLLEVFDFDIVLSYCHHNLANRRLETELRPVADATGTRVINASVLHMGLLTDAGPPKWHPASRELVETASEAARLCREEGTSLSELALRDALSADWVSVTLIGTTKMAHLSQAIEARANPPDPRLLERVRHILEPVLDETWPSGRWPGEWEERSI